MPVGRPFGGANGVPNPDMPSPADCSAPTWVGRTRQSRYPPQPARSDRRGRRPANKSRAPFVLSGPVAPSSALRRRIRGRLPQRRRRAARQRPTTGLPRRGRRRLARGRPGTKRLFRARSRCHGGRPRRDRDPMRETCRWFHRPGLRRACLGVDAESAAGPRLRLRAGLRVEPGYVVVRNVLRPGSNPVARQPPWSRRRPRPTTDTAPRPKPNPLPIAPATLAAVATASRPEQAPPTTPRLRT